MNKNRGFLKSLYCAATGLFKPLITERNMRVHFSFANLIMIFAYFFGLERMEWAVLVLTVSLVITAELINTAVENAVDTATKDFSPTAKAAKDVAAGAVLFCAIISVIMGFFLFFDADRISKTLYCIFSKPHILIPCLIIGIFDICFIIWGDKLLIKKRNN